MILVFSLCVMFFSLGMLSETLVKEFSIKLLPESALARTFAESLSSDADSWVYCSGVLNDDGTRHSHLKHKSSNFNLLIGNNTCECACPFRHVFKGAERRLIKEAVNKWASEKSRACILESSQKLLEEYYE